MITHFRADGVQLVPDPQPPSKSVGLAGFYDTADDAEALVVRPREMQDNAVPSGNAMAATVLLKLARLSGRTGFEDHAQAAIDAVRNLMGRYPQGFGQWLGALDAMVSEPVEVAIIGDPGAEDTRALVALAQEGYGPNRLVAVGTGDAPPLLKGRRQIDGRATAYVCRGAVCHAPVTEPEKLRARLEQR